MDNKTKTIVELVFLHFRDWRLLPWYERGMCHRGCCVHHEFSWLFIAIRVARVAPPNQES